MRLVAVLALALVQLASSVSGLVYLCSMDGRARLSCCCASDEPRPDETAIVSSTPCCQIASFEASRAPAVSEERRVGAPPPAPVAAPHEQLLAPASPAALVARAVRSEASPPGGPPRFLKLRTLLL